MAYNETLTNKIREALAHLKNVDEKKMFRGVSFMVDGKMCISVGDNEFMFRVDPAIHDKLIETKGVRPLIMKGREYKGYIYVHENVAKNNREFDKWVKLALDFNKIAKSSKKK